MKRSALVISVVLVMALIFPGFSQGEEDLSETSVQNMKKLIECFVEEGQFSDRDAARTLLIHLTAVGHFEARGFVEKAIRHMHSFKSLLSRQQEDELISEKAHRILKVQADELMNKWQPDFDADRAMDHIRYLSEELGPRVAGTDAERQAAEYIKEEFERLGYPVFIQEFNFDERRKDRLTIVSNHNEEIPLRSALGSAETDEDGITAHVYDAGFGTEGEFPEEVDGNIALIKRGKSSFRTAAKRAEEAGAIGLIVADNTDNLRAFRPGLSGETVSIPLVGVTKADGEALLSHIASGELKVHLSVRTLKDQTSQNVIAVKKPTHQNAANAGIVYVTAHYDSVPFSPGANDDASGTSLILELARIMKDFPTNKEVRFIAFGHEESGLAGSRVGSKYYVSQLSQDELDRSVANFQFDMVGTSWEPASQLNVNVVDGQPNLVWQYAKAAAERLGIDVLALFERGSSDHETFHDAGVDAANISWRVPGTADLEPYYHSPYDTIEHISPERIQIIGELARSAISELVLE